MKKVIQSKFFTSFSVPILVVLFSFFYALSLVPNHVVFGFDQARDAYEAYSIWHDHDIKILGPSSDIVGVNHGVLWYYVLALVYFFGNGVPQNAAYIFLVGLYVLVPVMGYFTYRMSKSIPVTSITIILYVMAPLYLLFTHWLSNPLLALYIIPPLLYMLWKYLHKQTVLLAGLIGLFYALLIQSDFAYVVLLFLVPIYFFTFSVRFRLWDFISFVGGLFIGSISFIITYLKFKTNIVGILFGFLGNGSGDSSSVGTVVFGFIDNMIRFINFTYLPLPRLLTLFTFVIILFILIRFRGSFSKTQDRLVTFVLIWLSGLIFMFVLNHGNLLHSFFYGPFLYPLALLVAILLVKLIKDFRLLVLIVAILVGLQFMETTKWTRNTNSPLSVQQGMTINYEQEIIDYIYTSANNEPFVIATITNPLDINTTWSYLFTFYGKQKYGYVPYLWSKDQKGYLGNLPAQTDLNEPSLRYLIIEPDAGIQQHWIDFYIYKEDLLSDITEEKQFGNFTVQKRLFHPDKPPFPQPK